MKNLPRISGYGNCSEGDYDTNTLKIEFDTLTLWYSYDTIVAFKHNENFCIRKNDWCTTTGKHLNWINADKNIRINGMEFENNLQLILKEYGLSN